MNIADLKAIIENLPDDMHVGLLDSTTDDFSNCNYPLTYEENFEVQDYVTEEGGEIEGEMLFIIFENKLNENPI